MLLDQQLVRSAGLRDNLPDLNNSESCCLGLFCEFHFLPSRSVESYQAISFNIERVEFSYTELAVSSTLKLICLLVLVKRP